MRLLQVFFGVLWVIGYVGNGILFLYIEWIYLRQGWVQIFNPFLQIQVLLTLFTTPIFWLLLAMAVLGYYLATVIEKRIDRNKEKSNSVSEKVSSILLPTETSIQSQTLSPPPSSLETVGKGIYTQGSFEVTDQCDNAFTKKQTELLEWAIQSSQRVQFDYVNRYGAKSHRTVTPLGFKTFGETKCLEAYCQLRQAKRTFVINRMRGIRLATIDETSNQSKPSPESIATEPSYTDSRISERPYIKYYTAELEKLANLEWNNITVLTNIYDELGFRSRQKAHDLRERISKRLNVLRGKQFSWPSTNADGGSRRPLDDVFPPGEGLLRHYGYKVGIHGLNQGERLKILDTIFLDPLLPMNDHAYLKEWGEPKTPERLQKLAESIAAFTHNAKRNNEKDFSKAIWDWETDLAYLKKVYYENYFSFKWPRT
jgi:hypothetical protein